MATDSTATGAAPEQRTESTTAAADAARGAGQRETVADGRSRQETAQRNAKAIEGGDPGGGSDRTAGGAEHARDPAERESAPPGERREHAARRAEALEKPHPELTDAAAAALEERRQDVVERYPEDCERLSPDPDKGSRPPGPKEREEATTALDMREARTLPADVRRPDEPGRGDFVGTVDGKDEYYDIKQFRDRWPEESGRSPEDPFPANAGGYSSEDFARSMEKQLQRDRSVILDTRSLRQQTIDDMARIIDEKGWMNHVKWYP